MSTTRRAAEPRAEPRSFGATERRVRYDTAFAQLDAPFAFVDLDAMWSNSRSMLARAAGKPIRVASKSLRCRTLVKRILDTERGYQGQLCFTLPEALWLASNDMTDLVVAYPSTDRRAIKELAERTQNEPDTAPVIMVDSVAHLDYIARLIGSPQHPLRTCLDFDASLWLAEGRVKIGAKRTPVHTPQEARQLAEQIERHPTTRLVGMMCYEGHIAGTGDIVPGNPVKSALIRKMQQTSYDELKGRRAEAVQLVSEIVPLEFVNAGGTGDLERVASEPAMTEATAGSGFYAPTLFDNYTAFELEPAAMFALPVCRRPGPGIVTALGGGYLASGAGAKDRMPTPYLPSGLKLDALEGTGEVQTPLKGSAANVLKLGDKVYFRHTKAGELCERFDRLYLIERSEIVDELPTYRGEGKTFL